MTHNLMLNQKQIGTISISADYEQIKITFIDKLKNQYENPVLMLLSSINERGGFQVKAENLSFSNCSKLFYTALKEELFNYFEITLEK